MTPDEVVLKCSHLGIVIHRRTLLNYEGIGLNPPAIRTGKSTNYPIDTAEMAVKANLLLNHSGLIMPVIKQRYPKVYDELADILRKQVIDIGGNQVANIQK